MNDSRGQVVFAATSNRAGFAWDAVIDATLLAANASKTVQIVSSRTRTTKPTHVSASTHLVEVDNTASATSVPEQAIASYLKIQNSSGQSCTVLVTVQRAGNVFDSRYSEVARNPIRLADGESITINERVVSFVETNIGAGTQTGWGVRYYAGLEPSDK